MNRGAWAADLLGMGSRFKNPAAAFEAALGTVREHIDEAQNGLSGPRVEVFCRQAGCAAWNVLKGAGWPIPNLPSVLCESPIEVFYGDEFPHPETGEIMLEEDEVESFHIWWLAFIRWLSEQSDVPVTLPGRTLSDLLHHVLRNMGHYGAFAFIPAPDTDELAEAWPDIRLASVQAIDYMLPLGGCKTEQSAEPVGDILTVAQAATLLVVSEATVVRLIDAGKLKAATVQGRATGGKSRQMYRIMREWVYHYMNENVHPTPPTDTRGKTAQPATGHDYFS